MDYEKAKSMVHYVVSDEEIDRLARSFSNLVFIEDKVHVLTQMMFSVIEDIQAIKVYLSNEKESRDAK